MAKPGTTLLAKLRKLISKVSNLLRMRTSALLLATALMISLNANAQFYPGNGLQESGKSEQINNADITIETAGRQHMMQGLVALNAGKLEHALNEIEKAFKYIENANLYFYHGLILSKLERHVEAFESYNKSIELDPTNANMYHFAGLSLQKMGDFRASIPYWNDYITRKSGTNRAYYYRGLALYHSGESGKALEDLIKASSIEPSHWEAFDLMSNIWAERGDTERACKYVAMALEYDDKNESAKTKLASLRADLEMQNMHALKD